MSDTGLRVQLSCFFQLDFADVDSDDLDTGLTDDAAHRAADAATNVHHRHARFQVQLRNHQPLMPNDGFFQALIGCERYEMQGFVPTPHHEPAAKIIVLFHRCRMVVPACAIGFRSRPCRPSGPAVEVPDTTLDGRSVVSLTQISGQFTQFQYGDLSPVVSFPRLQEGSSCLCSETTNFSFLLGFKEGNGLNLSLKFAGDISSLK